MANKLDNITIVFVKGKTANDKSILNKDFSHSEGYKTGDTIKGFFSIQYSNAGVANCFFNYMERPLGKAGGYGYAKDGVALAEAVNKVYGTEFRNHGEGLRHTLEQMKASDFEVKEMYEVL